LLPHECSSPISIEVLSMSSHSPHCFELSIISSNPNSNGHYTTYPHSMILSIMLLSTSKIYNTRGMGMGVKEKDRS
jgi:hypothetical protein